MIRHGTKNVPSPGWVVLVMWAWVLVATSSAWGAGKVKLPDPNTPCCDFSKVPGVVWHGSDPIMTFDRLASYCGPILWFSPDEPLLGPERGKAIRLTQVLPFEEDPGAPVLYYRIDRLLVRGDADGPATTVHADSKGESVIDLRQVGAIDLRFCLYYPSEEGLGGHRHDLEVVDMKIAVYRWSDWLPTQCPDCEYVLSIRKAESVNESETLEFDNLDSTSSLLADRSGNDFLS